MSNLESYVLGFLFGVMATTLGRILYDYLKAPDLKAYQRAGDPDIQEVDNRRRAFYHLALENKREGLMANPAYNARVAMTFLDKENREMFRIPAKWDFRSEPLRREIKNGRLVEFPEPSLIPQTELLDINPNSVETFCICLKYEGEEEAYAFTAFSYLYPELKNPRLKLSRGVYRLHIVVNAANAHREFEFLVKNEGTKFQDLVVEVD